MKQDLETFYIIALILAKIFFRGIYLLTLFIAIGGLLHWGLYPTMKGLRLMDFYYIIPFILASAGILILLSLLEQKFPHVKIMPFCGNMTSILIKPVLWTMFILSFSFIVMAWSEDFMYSNPIRFLKRALPVLSVSAVLLCLIYLRERKHKKLTK